MRNGSSNMRVRVTVSCLYVPFGICATIGQDSIKNKSIIKIWIYYVYIMRVRVWDEIGVVFRWIQDEILWFSWLEMNCEYQIESWASSNKYWPWWCLATDRYYINSQDFMIISMILYSVRSYYIIRVSSVYYTGVILYNIILIYYIRIILHVVLN